MSSTPHQPPRQANNRDDGALSPFSQSFGTVQDPTNRPYSMFNQENAQAGPSTGYPREMVPVESYDIAPDIATSAPPTPLAKNVIYPPEYIHTHQYRRSSMTPIGLNVITPNPPIQFPFNNGQTPTSTFQPSFSPQRAVGFHPESSPTSTYTAGPRRSSNASTASTLTQSRPPNFGTALPSGFNRERRRSSLTPSNPSLAPPSPVRHNAKGRNSRPSSSDGPGSVPGSQQLHARTRTEPTNNKTLGSPMRDLYSGIQSTDFGRRGSMPQLAYGGWTGPGSSLSGNGGGGGATGARNWNPSLPPQRSSESYGHPSDLPEDNTINEGFKFGSVPSATTSTSLTASASMPISPSPAQAALKAIGQPSPSWGRRSSLFGASQKAGTPGDVFEEAEAEEAERQRRAFIAATYGVDGKRARERLSIGGHPTATPHGSPGSSLRRPSLMLWEKLGAAAAQRAAEAVEAGSASAPSLPITTPISPIDSEILGARRGSLPMAVPGSGLGRSMSKREQRENRENDMDAPLIVRQEVDEDEEEEEEDVGDPVMSGALSPPARPLPPLLPLSDPGPRLLPSTLALHRASHLLNFKNLESEPLPHPLPRSLHPPAPVDVTEFDIDFILAGSRAQLGGDKKARNAPIDALRASEPNVVATPTLKLGPGGEDEDSFAKFVGEFDDEYGGRRGEWTFRSCVTGSPVGEESRDPLDPSPLKPLVRAEWESHGAGKYELYGNGEVKSIKTGSIWRVRKTAMREFELSELHKGNFSASTESEETQGDGKKPQHVTIHPTVMIPGTTYIFTSKSLHNDHGGIMFPNPSKNRSYSNSGSRSNSIDPPTLALLRASVSDAPSNRSDRMNSGDSAISPADSLSRSLPLGSALNAMLPKKKRQGSKDASALIEEATPQSRMSVSFANKSESKKTHQSPSFSKNDKDEKQGHHHSSSGGGLAAFGAKLERSFSRDPPSSDDKDKDGKKKDKGHSSSIGGVFKRGIIGAIKQSQAHAEEKKAAKEERDRERAQSQSWSGADKSHRDGNSSWIHPSGRTMQGQGTYYSNPVMARKSSTGGGTGSGLSSKDKDREKERSSSRSDKLERPSGLGLGSALDKVRSGSLTPSLHSSSEDRMTPIYSDSNFSDVALASDLEDTPQQRLNIQTVQHHNREGKAWNVVPEDAIAIVIPIESDGQNGPCTISNHTGSPNPNEPGPRQGLLVWYVPFGAEDRPPERLDVLIPTSSKESSREVSSAEQSPAHSSGSLPKFQKLLRRRASREKDGLKSPSTGSGPSAASGVPPPKQTSSGSAVSYYPLPFRSFRIVAKVVDWEDLKSDVATPVISNSQAFDSWNAERQGTIKASASPSPISPTINTPFSAAQVTSPTSYTSHTATGSTESGAGTVESESGAGSTSTAPTSTTSNIMAGRMFPTVIAVCHSRSQGVEFVLEGLDRLGFCQGESAWGPTGYEEWRGTGLSDKGRELLDLLWAGCTAILGISA